MSISSMSESSYSISNDIIVSYISTLGTFYGYKGASANLDCTISLSKPAKKGCDSTSSAPPLLPNRSYLAF